MKFIKILKKALLNRINRKGSVIIAILVTMIIMAVIGSAMVSLNSSSKMTQVSESLSLKAFYLAETGYRYLENEFEKGASINDLVGNDFSIEAGHNFKLKIVPYVFKVASSSNNLVTIKTGTKALDYDYDEDGCVPPDTSSWNQGYIMIDGLSRFFKFQSVSNVADSNQIKLNGGGAGALAALPNSNAFLCATHNGTYDDSGSKSMNLTNGSGISLVEVLTNTAGDGYSGSTLPEINGFFRAYTIANSSEPKTDVLNPKTFSYKQRIGNKLTGIMEVVDLTTGEKADLTSNITAGYLSLNPYLKVASNGSTGTYLKTTNFYLPISIEGVDPVAGKTTDSSAFDDDVDHSTTKTRKKGEYSIEDNVLKVEKANLDDFGFGLSNLGFDQPIVLIEKLTSDALLSKAWEDAGNFLSYDTQVKVAIVGAQKITWKQDPSLRFAGINFRTTNISATDGRGYGLSFQRGYEKIYADGIEANVLPKNYSDLITLWEWNTSGSDSTWITYKDICPYEFDTDTEDKIKTIESYSDSKNRKYYALNDWSTLLLRVIEGASYRIHMNKYPGSKPGLTGNPLNNGDAVMFRRDSSCYSAVVKGDPIRKSGTWEDKTFKGVLILNNIELVTGTKELDSSIPEGHIFKNELKYAVGDMYRAKDTYLRVFYGDNGSSTTTNTSYSDNVRAAHKKDSTINPVLIKWLPNELLSQWINTDFDNFTLVEFAKLKADPDTNHLRNFDIDDDYQADDPIFIPSEWEGPRSIVRLSTFKTPDSGNFSTSTAASGYVSTRPEISLFAGSRQATKTQFTDFAYQVDGNSSSNPGNLFYESIQD